MVNSRIFITGSLDKEPKVNEDGSADLILNNTVDEHARKDIKDKGNSIFLVKLSKAQWKSKKNSILKPNREIKVVGHIKALVNKKGTPFIYVAPQSVEVYEVKDEKNTNNRQKSFKGMINQINVANKKYIPWRKAVDESEFIELDPAKVILEDDEHINAQFNWMDFKKGRNIKEFTVAVRKIDEDKYALVSGIGRYIVAKVFNMKLSAYVTDLTREEFANEFDIKQSK
ncbi:hypothetical protein LEQ06_19820 [Paraclostridium sp. AKS46]|uniref:Single-stranded DNA-binding protein n=1 Tax=Paraclostridium bifermentans TaxID=1490 RepID=A0A5P3XBI3_PARBF|nr:hypothetical protein [Paraclostridium bifermentans]MCU9810188.1 hypothetical protein [Paraclostridium sp. AKS46]QEZ68476.1 hypothetical protein D4A35_05800 [Paraclostridium bifermentans]